MPSSYSSNRGSNPGSALLQDMLREKKAQTQRTHKPYDSASQSNVRKNGPDDGNIQSSPLASVTGRERSGASGRRNSGAPKEMGLREMEEHISKINKQNFDLKLELFHRRQRNEELEVKVEKMDTLETDNQELQSINEDLLLELEKRDVAVQEAVNLICELEAKIEEMGEADSYFKQRSRTPELRGGDSVPASPSSTKSKSNDLGTPPQTKGPNMDLEGQARAGDSPPHIGSLSPTASNPARRVPSFLRDTKKSTNVLRSLYVNDGKQTQGNLSSHSLARPGSMFSGEDEDEDYIDRQMLNSPRLSVLSESGFSSIYGSPKERSLSPAQNLDAHVSQQPLKDSQSPRNDQREERLQDWLEGSDRPSTPPRQKSRVGLNDQFSSIDQVLERTPSNSNGQQPENTKPGEPRPRQERSPEKHIRKGDRERQRRPSSPAFGGPMFGGGVLPPTPDTMSTGTVAASSSTPSIVTEKSLLDGTPYPAKAFSALMPTGRPSTSDSSLTSNFGTALVYNQGRSSPHAPSSESRSPKAEQRLVRPSLTTSVTDSMFNAEDYSPAQACRTFSYPSPARRTRRGSSQLSPVSSKGSNPLSERTATLSPRDHTSASSATATPRKRSPRNTQQGSPTATRDNSTPRPMSTETQREASLDGTRASTLRSKTAKISLTPSQTTQKSIASRLFRRSNSQTVQKPPQPSSSPARPPIAHARQPRPTSLYGSSPVYARPGTADNDESVKPSFLPKSLRRHSAVLDGGDVWSASLHHILISELLHRKSTSANNISDIDHREPRPPRPSTTANIDHREYRPPRTSTTANIHHRQHRPPRTSTTANIDHQSPASLHHILISELLHRKSTSANNISDIDHREHRPPISNFSAPYTYF
ncbi:hypothetical protein N7G274_006295 [Stereocaulon virgatum]|uniref:Centrosomin N-terminal motif 1 domain-containing protein n=1 Tax=Stereocaulon virgatum TaxID=373712 RepID=A0ABR4A4J4_9LECA